MMKIRKATLKDIPEIARLLHEYDLHENNLDKTRKIDKISEIINFNKKLMKKSGVVYFVLEEKGKLFGTISGEPLKNALGKAAIFHNIFISKEKRGKGYGKKLINSLENYFKKKGCISIKSFVYGKNKKSLEFYKKLNYQIDYGFDIRKTLK
jgi:L-amino acid N-acyltransferase YncA